MSDTNTKGPLAMTTDRVSDDRLRSIIEQGARLIWISADGDELFSALSELLALREAVADVVAQNRDYLWPWDYEDYKPDADRRRNLVKSAALTLAELERLDRASLKENHP